MDQTTEKKPTEGTPPAVTPEQIAELQKDVKAAAAQAAKVEAAMVDTSYTDYLAARVAAKLKPAESDEKPTKKEIKISDLSPEEYDVLMQERTADTVAKAIDPVKQALLTKQALDDVKESAGKHEDFWEYQQEMMAVAKQIPNLTAEDCYQLAKAKTGPKEKKEKPAAGEAPIGMEATKIVREPPKGFSSKAKIAWERTFGKESIAS